MKRTSLLQEFLQYLKTRKRYWLFPLILTMVLIGLIVFIGQNTVVGTFIYAIF
ncbi:DUF5989 family protein [Pseudodesulfovibrio senegalensis]|uniref:DUF5989 family protein n=1 Tax=Pseudodesulfovibrio senegalensis TaxID=1721087 RepID=UPI003BAAFBCF